MPSHEFRALTRLEMTMSDGVKVLVVILIIWVGIFLYLMKLDGEVRRLKRGQRDG